MSIATYDLAGPPRKTTAATQNRVRLSHQACIHPSPWTCMLGSFLLLASSVTRLFFPFTDGYSPDLTRFFLSSLWRLGKRALDDTSVSHSFIWWMDWILGGQSGFMRRGWKGKRRGGGGWLWLWSWSWYMYAGRAGLMRNGGFHDLFCFFVMLMFVFFGRGYDFYETKRSLMMFMLCSCNDDGAFWFFVSERKGILIRHVNS